MTQPLFLACLYLSDNLRIPQIDLGFAISATAVSAPDTFQHIKETIMRIIEEYGITRRLRNALVVFGRDAVPILSFSEDFVHFSALKTKIMSAPRPVGEPNLENVLKEAKKMFDPQQTRPGVKKVLVVIIDKKSTSSPENVRKALAPLEEQKVKIVPVAVGSFADTTELEGITSNRGYLIETPRDLDPDITAEEIMAKVLKGMALHHLCIWVVTSLCFDQITARLIFGK